MKKAQTLLLLLSLTMLLTACIPADNQANSTLIPEEKQTKEEDTTKGSVPENLISCDPAYFERGDDDIAPDCDTFGGDKVCSYHTKEQNGKIKNETIQYNNACAACRFYGETGVRKLGSATFTHKGYIEGGCEGIIWE
jgi:hypothetical protein